MVLADDIQSKIQEWTNAPYEEDCINDIRRLVESQDEEELIERFAVNMKFGTGGLRGIIRNGTNGMNVYVIAKATQGIANYIKNQKIVDPKAVIAYDSRRFSKEFARKTAQVLASNGIKTFLFKNMRPTPELSFALRYLGCNTGIVITASHNPKEYNGFKVYWEDGAQIIAPHDQNIISEVEKINLLNEVQSNDFENLVKNGLIEWIEKETDRAYLDEILKLAINYEEIQKSHVKIVYTPLHGTGSTLVPRALKELGFKNILYVEEQMQEDPDFSTVKKPNPEEKAALSMAIELAEKENADLVIATDPDADRMGIAVKDENGDFQIISGNHIGSILEYYIITELKKRRQLPENGAVVKTIVTTKLQDIIALENGLDVFNVLTGFKYIGQKIRNFEDDGDHTYVFGGEESYGYLNGTYARDKDAVSASLLIAECFAYLKNQGRTIIDYLEEIFTKYGYFDDKTISIDILGLKGTKIIQQIMRHFRSTPPAKICGLDVIGSVDYDVDLVFDRLDSKYSLPKANVLQYILADDSMITLRPSGTEPKIKLYFSVMAESKQECQSKLADFENNFIPEIKKLIQELS